MPQSEDERTGTDLDTAESVNHSDEVLTFRHINNMLCMQNYVMQLTDEVAVVVAKAYFSLLRYCVLLTTIIYKVY